MIFIRLLPLLFCCSALAQVNLLIEDETGSGFLLGINGYVQNTDPVKAMVIQKLDTFPFEVRVELAPNAFFYKKMHFHESGSYRYIITTNSRDELQLRYRGTLKDPPASVITMNVQNMLPLNPLATTAKVDSKPAVLPPPDKSVAGNDDAIVKPVPPAIPKKDTLPSVPATTAVVNEPIAVAQKEEEIIEPRETQPPAEVISPEKTFDTFLEELKATEFEFEKLNKAQEFATQKSFTSHELKKVLEIIKYDNTRLELLRNLKPMLKEMKDPEVLKEALEYEISKQQLNDIINL